jgi:hypothetical protein
MTILQIKSTRDFHQSRADKTIQAFSRISNFFRIKDKVLEKKEVFLFAYKYAIYKNLEGEKLGSNPMALGSLSNLGAEELDTLAMAIFSINTDLDILQKGDECIKTTEMLANKGALALSSAIEEYPLSINYLEDLVDDISKELENILSSGESK